MALACDPSLLPRPLLLHRIRLRAARCAPDRPQRRQRSRRRAGRLQVGPQAGRDPRRAGPLRRGRRAVRAHGREAGGADGLGAGAALRESFVEGVAERWIHPPRSFYPAPEKQPI